MLPITPGTHIFQRKARDSNPQADCAATCFQDRFLIRPDAFRLQAAGAGIEPTLRRSERPVLPLDDPASFASPRHACPLESSGRRCRTSASWFNARWPPVSRSPILKCRKSALWESNPPRQLGRLEPLPLGQGHVSNQGGSRGSRTPKAVKLVPVRAGCHRQLACTSVRLRRQESNLRQGG